MSRQSAPGRRSSVRWLTLFLAGPVIWYLYFWFVYLVAEAGCALGGREFSLLELPGVSLITITSTVLASGVIVWSCVLAVRWLRRDRAADEGRGDQHSVDRREERRFLLFNALLLGAVFLVATLFVGIPALVLSAC